MKYKASDIIKQAKSLANISNTDFISFTENIDYINDAFTSVYVDMISKNDTFWLRRGYSATLPSDLYQIRAVYNGPNIVPVKSASNRAGYEIVNNKIKGQFTHYDYYPNPFYVTFPKEAYSKSLQVAGLYDIGYNKLYSWSNGELTITDLFSNESEQTTVEGVTRIIAGQDDCFLVTSDGYLFGNGNTLTEMPAAILRDPDYRLYYVTTDGIVKDAVGNNPIAEIDLTEDMPFCIGAINGERTDIWLYDTHYSETDSKMTKASTEIYPFMWNNESSIISKVNNSYWINNEIKIDLPPVVYGYNPADESFVCYKNTSTVEYVSAYPDTVLNWPNNIYYRMMAGYLAIGYLSKMGSDLTSVSNYLTGLQDLYNKTKTVADYSRITNVY